MKSCISIGLAGAGLWVFATTATAQTAAAPNASEEIVSLEEIVVTARRKDESLQDVPTTINAVTGEEIQKLNIRDFKDIGSVIPGLSMAPAPNGLGGSANVRGVAYDVQASGNNGTVEFYLNDAPISAGNLFQTVYDIQQIELLRGPQGTLRGSASPSGSMTVITRRPDLQEMGGYVSGSGNNIGGYNGQGAVNFPIISNMLAIRVAGAYDKNEGNRVVSLNNSTDPTVKSKSGRLTVRFEPTDSLSFILTAQKTNFDSVTFDQVESQQVVNPNAPVINSAVIPLFAQTYVPPYITASQRLAVVDTPRVIEQDFNNYNLQAQWAFLGQKLNYVVARNEQDMDSFEPQDIGDFFSPQANAVYQGFGQQTHVNSYSTAHELRVSNEERVFGMFDYIVGAFTQKANFPTNLTRNTATFNPNQGPPFSNPALYLYGLSPSAIVRTGGSEEKSVFINLTAHLGEALEVSAGARYIDYFSQGTLTVNGNKLTTAEDNGISDNAMIYTGSVKYNITEDFMAYATVGTSWRPRISAVGDFSLAQSALEQSFLSVAPEKSTSYEVGFKSTMLDKRLRTNVSLYHQKFDNYPYRSPSGVWYVDTLPPAQGGARANIFNFVAGVPVEVNGVEAQVDFSATKNWDMGLSAAASKGEIKGGVIPCNDFAPQNGVPDSSGTVPSLTTLQTAYGANNLAACSVTQRASPSPQWSGSLQSEYRLPITASLNSFVRGQMSIYGNSVSDPIYSHDDADSYQLLNLYLGVRDPGGVWEVSIYGKNVTNTERVLSRSGFTMTTPLNLGVGQTNYYGGTATSGLTMTPPREFGVSLRYAFGSM
jgi:iron complex outermembrane receptor protein